MSTPEQVQIVNTSIVRDPDGKLTLWVGNEKMLGVGTLTMQPQPDGVGMWVLVIPSNRVRLCERVPEPPVYEADNVVPFAARSTLPLTTANNPDPRSA